MKLRSLSKREKILLYLAILVVSGIFIFNLVIEPLTIKLARMNEDIRKKEYLLKKYRSLTGKGEDILSLYSRYKGSLAKGQRSQEIIDSLFEEVKKTAATVHLNLEKIKPLPIEKNRHFQQALLEVELKGTFSSIFTFIDQLENSSSFVRISSLRLVPQAKDSSVLNCTVTVSRIFF
jgi:Tfp pilus assembly protein PilO